MDNPEYPANSETSKKIEEDKGVTRITSGDVVRKKKSLRKRFTETFVAGDAKSVFGYVVMDVLLPAARDMVVDAVDSGFRRLIFGESYRRRGGSTLPQAGPTGYVSYNRYAHAMGSRQSGPERTISRQARARHDFDEIVLDSRTEAEEVIDRLFDLVSRYESATVADLYELVGLSSNHTDQKWGWTDLQGSGVSRIRDGYLLDLPDPEPLG